ncbi:hypothetical protein ACLKA6_004926 [Drosophila palustris]
MQTGSSGCQYNWLTIVMLVGLVLSFSQRQQQHSAPLATWGTCTSSGSSSSSGRGGNTTLAASESDTRTAAITTAAVKPPAGNVKLSPAVSMACHAHNNKNSAHAHGYATHGCHR